ncbi:MAG: AraC family transcriptional regulator [Bacteroidaceae bacterium]
MKKVNLPFERFALNLLQDTISTNRNVLLFPDMCGLFYCQQGEAVVSMNGCQLTIKPGDVYIYMPSSYVYIISTTPDLDGVTYKASLEYALEMLENIPFTSSILALKENPCVSLTTMQRNMLEELLEAIERRSKIFETLKANDESKIMLQESLSKLGEVLLHEVFYYFFANQPVVHNVMDMKGIVFQNFLTTLMQRYKREREVAYYANEQNITSRYFSSIVKEKTGRSPKEWIVQIVINSIKQTLLYSGKSVKEIAIEYNFPSQSFFGKYFKQYVGLSPREFREDAKARYLGSSTHA